MADGADKGPSDRASMEQVLRLAHGLLKGGRYADAIPALLQAAELLPDNPVVFDDLGRAYLLTRRLPEAITRATPNRSPCDPLSRATRAP